MKVVILLGENFIVILELLPAAIGVVKLPVIVKLVGLVPPKVLEVSVRDPVPVFSIVNVMSEEEPPL